MRSILPLRDLTNKAIKYLPNGGFEIIYDSLSADTPYILDVSFIIEKPDLIDAIVDRRSPREVPSDDKMEYWMHAQLKFIDVLEKIFSEVKFEDLDFFVNVAVYQDIKTSIPPAFMRELEVVINWMKETDREKKARLSRDHLRILRGRRGIKRKHLLDFLKEIQDMFVPSTFRKFIKIERDFYYHDCIRGTDYFTLPFPTWPKFMTVISRTSLTLEKPAAEGKLEFKRSNFKKEIEEIFTKRKKKS